VPSGGHRPPPHRHHHAVRLTPRRRPAPRRLPGGTGRRPARGRRAPGRRGAGRRGRLQPGRRRWPRCRRAARDWTRSSRLRPDGPGRAQLPGARRPQRPGQCRRRRLRRLTRRPGYLATAHHHPPAPFDRISSEMVRVLPACISGEEPSAVILPTELVRRESA
jgi:hypothetical protein